MPSVQASEANVLIRFGGGVHSRASEADINDAECSYGYNFDLDVLNREYRPRAPFVLCSTAPNAARINGYATFRDTSGNVTLLVQAGTTVYKYDGVSTWTSVGTVSASTRLRGRFEHISEIDGVVLITDLALVDPVYEWDGTTFSTVAFTDESGAAFGTFRARYCHVDNERAIFANVYAGSATSNLIVGSSRSDYKQISIANRPSSALSEGDPFFIVQPDNGAINGMANAFGLLAFSSQYGDIYKLTGSSAKDFAMGGLFPRAGAAGTEAMVGVGSDIFFGRQGRIESLVASDKYGDVESNDVSLQISDQISDVATWTAAYNQRLQRAYFWPADGGTLYVYHYAFAPPPASSQDPLAQALSGKKTAQPDASPWALWKTTHTSDFAPTAVMPVYYPTNGLEYVLFGDASGNVYRLEGEYGAQDAGTDDVTTMRLSKRFQMDAGAAAFNIVGYISYRKADAFAITMTLEASGENIFDQAITINVPAATGGSYYGGAAYYGGSNYYGLSFRQRVSRQKFALAGKTQEFQIRLAVTEDTLWRIEEIGLRFEAAN